MFQNFINSIPCRYRRKLKTGKSKLKVRDVLWPPQSAGRRKNALKGAHSACLVGTGWWFGHAGRARGLRWIFSHRCPSQRRVPPSFYILSPTQGFCFCMPVFKKMFCVYTANVIKKERGMDLESNLLHHPDPRKNYSICVLSGWWLTFRNKL